MDRIRLDWQNSGDSQLSFLYRTANFNQSSIADYQQSHELEMKYHKVIDTNFLTLKLYLGRSNLGDNFVQTAISYTWYFKVNTLGVSNNEGYNLWHL